MSSRSRDRYFKLVLGPVAAKAIGLPVFTQRGDLLQFGSELTGLLGLSAGVVVIANGAGVTNGDTHDHSGGDGAQINHTGLSNIGTNTHAQIDTHLGSTSNPHGVTLAQAVTAGGTTADDVEITDSAKGLILKAPNGTRYRVTVDNAGVLTTTSL